MFLPGNQITRHEFTRSNLTTFGFKNLQFHACEFASCFSVYEPVYQSVCAAHPFRRVLFCYVGVAQTMRRSYTEIPAMLNPVTPDY